MTSAEFSLLNFRGFRALLQECGDVMGKGAGGEADQSAYQLRKQNCPEAVKIPEVRAN